MHTISCCAQFHAAWALPCLICAHISPHIAIESRTQTQAVATTRIAAHTAHTDRVSGIARQIIVLGPESFGISAIRIVTIGIDDCEEKKDSVDRWWQESRGYDQQRHYAERLPEARDVENAQRRAVSCCRTNSYSRAFDSFAGFAPPLRPDFHST